jgi:hypothetical protein
MTLIAKAKLRSRKNYSLKHPLIPINMLEAAKAYQAMSKIESVNRTGRQCYQKTQVNASVLFNGRKLSVPK